jgi:ribonuclease BN (tRNA processing enzyme)
MDVGTNGEASFEFDDFDFDVLVKAGQNGVLFTKGAYLPKGPARLAPQARDILGRMRLTVLGGCGAWPAAGQACSGYLLEHDGFRLLVDPGYATLPQLLRVAPAESIDAVVVSHGHPDHCADLNPLLRARMMSERPPPRLPVYALPGAVDQVLTLDQPAMMEPGLDLREFRAGAELTIGPFGAVTWPLPHFVPNAGMRLSAGGVTVAYTGDSGPREAMVALAHGADLFLAEATYAEVVPAEHAGNLSCAAQIGRDAARAGARRLMLTHLWPGSDPAAFVAAARRGRDGVGYEADITVARGGIIIDIDP